MNFNFRYCKKKIDKSTSNDGRKNETGYGHKKTCALRANKISDIPD